MRIRDEQLINRFLAATQAVQSAQARHDSAAQVVSLEYIDSTCGFIGLI